MYSPNQTTSPGLKSMNSKTKSSPRKETSQTARHSATIDHVTTSKTTGRAKDKALVENDQTEPRIQEMMQDFGDMNGAVNESEMESNVYSNNYIDSWANEVKNLGTNKKEAL